MKKIYIFETRELDYLNSYINKAKSIGYATEIVSSIDLVGCKKFNRFKEIYQHLSVGTVEFELSCFARYFAIANKVDDNDTFVLSDSDIYLTNRILELNNDSTLKDVFVGSEGYFSQGSEWQISPHFSIWNKYLIRDFVDFLISSYERNKEDSFLVKHYEIQKKRLGRTSISDMTLLYMWVNSNKIPYKNSNSKTNNWGIDHNISTLIGEKEVYISSHNRKKIGIQKDSSIQFYIENGMKLDMSVVHFQGGYKRILNDFYLGNYKKFDLFSMYINLGRKINKFIK